jgi:hypothetical protein
VELEIDAPRVHHRTLRGCVSRRDLDWLHVVPDGSAIVCCQDYFERYRLGSVAESSVDDVLGGPALRRFRAWISGAEPAPDDFICRSCVFAVSEEISTSAQMQDLFCRRCALPDSLHAPCEQCVIAEYR